MRLKIFILIAFAFVSCRKENAFDCFKPNGNAVAETRREGEFSVIKVYDKIDLTIKQGPEFIVEVKAGEKIISNVSTKNFDHVLVIKNLNKCNFVRGYKKVISVTVTAPKIAQINNEGVGTVWIDEKFTQDTLVVRAENSGDIYVKGTYNQIRTSSHGNGDIYLSGQCNSLRVFSFGTNYTFGRDLKIADHVFVETLSIGHCYINAPSGGRLEYNLWRSGNIFYKGEPAEIIDYSNGTGTGRLIKEQ